MTKILITGAAGYVGSALARMLIQKNFDVWLIDNYSTPSNITEIEGVRIEKKDIRDGSLNLSHIDVLFHLAAISGIKRCDKDPQAAIDVNTRSILNLLKNFKGKIIFPSTSAVYGQCQYSPIDEKHFLNPRSLYGSTKLEAEFLIQKNIENFVIFRFSNIYGRGIFNKRTVIDNFIDLSLQRKSLEIHGDGKQKRDFVHLNDTLSAYWIAMRSEIGGIFNVGGNQALSINDIAELVVKSYRKVFGYSLGISHIATDCGMKWKDFEYSSKLIKNNLNHEPSYSIGDEIRERFIAYNRKK